MTKIFQDSNPYSFVPPPILTVIIKEQSIAIDISFRQVLDDDDDDDVNNKQFAKVVECKKCKSTLCISNVKLQKRKVIAIRNHN